MKRFLKATLVVAALALLIWALASYMESRRSLWHRLKNPETVAKLKQFVALKEAQANADTNGVPSEIRAILEQAKRGDWLALSNSMSDIPLWNFGWQHGWQHDWHPHGLKMAAKYYWCLVVARAGGRADYLAPPDMNGAGGAAAYELKNAFDVFWKTDEKISEQFGQELITSIPPGSIYLGGDDAGRLIPTIMLTPLSERSPFFILPQWIFRFRDTGEIERLRSTYGKKINLPTAAEIKKCLDDYLVQLRDGKTQDSPFDVMGITGLAIQRLMAANPQREFYLSEEWLIGNLLLQYEPHGLVLKVNPQPMEKISDEVLQRDHDFWSKEIKPLIGDWLKDKTSIAELAAFAKKTFGEDDLTGFAGDVSYIHSASTQAMFVRARCSIAGVYAWRARKATDEAEGKRMARAADFALRQAWALCPSSPEAFYGYINFLLSQDRPDDALLVAETFSRLPQVEGTFTATNTLAYARQWRVDHPPKPAN
ncbi:MAG: hypothetical protein RL616_2215 [Verrucomicrobiota bacterium]|jgi:hypothetical protein